MDAVIKRTKKAKEECDRMTTVIKEDPGQNSEGDILYGRQFKFW